MRKLIGRIREKTLRRLTLNLAVTILAFLNLVLTMGVILAAVLLMINWNVLSAGSARLDVRQLIIDVALASIILGSVISWLLTRLPLRSVKQLTEAMNQLAAGEFQTRLQLGPWISKLSAVQDITNSFNKMAEELEQTEMLRGDFVNHFSHEFKTPIVSIAGFASLLKHGNLSAEQQAEYVSVIEEESLRLSAMATNVLKLTRVENQTILTNTRRFNLSEQIRSCVLLLESRWSAKNQEIMIDLPEVEIVANEELLKEVWINLLDNAVKFTPAEGRIKIWINKPEKAVSVTISNTGSQIPHESLDRIFQKFYQADESHATQGNGVGLAIVKSVVNLHGGQVFVVSENLETAFTVLLPVHI